MPRRRRVRYRNAADMDQLAPSHVRNEACPSQSGSCRTFTLSPPGGQSLG